MCTIACMMLKIKLMHNVTMLIGFVFQEYFIFGFFFSFEIIHSEQKCQTVLVSIFIMCSGVLQ